MEVIVAARSALRDCTTDHPAPEQGATRPYGRLERRVPHDWRCDHRKRVEALHAALIIAVNLAVLVVLLLLAPAVTGRVGALLYDVAASAVSVWAPVLLAAIIVVQHHLQRTARGLLDEDHPTLAEPGRRRLTRG